ASTGQAAQTPVNLVSSMPCSSSSQQVNDIGRPTYVLTPNTPGHAVDVHVGDTLQVRLSSASRWSFRVASNAAVLTAIAPTGIYAPTLKACVWTFQARSAGSETLTYTGAPNCMSGEPCAAYRIALEFSVKVS